MTKQEWKNIRGSKPSPDQILLTIKGDAATSMTVRWRTGDDINNGYVLYRKAGTDDLWQKAQSVINFFETDVDTANFHFADMTSLTPDTEYEYTVGDDTHRSNTYTFKTARKSFDRFSFLCVSDIQTGGPNPPADYRPMGKTLKKILDTHPECEFILTAGDNTNCGQTDVQWTGLMQGLEGISESIPVMLCMGNHDDMGFEDYFNFTGKYYSEHATYFTNMLLHSYAHNGPKDWLVANYAFDYGNCHFAIMGTSGFEYINEWLLKDAEQSDKTWKFGAHHFPVCYSGPSIECEDTYPALRDGMEKYDVIFSGHEHSFARSYPRRNDGLYDKPSEGTVHYNLGSGNQNPPGTRSVKKIWNAKTYHHEEELSMFCIADVDGDTLTLTSFTENGRVVDSCVIDKNNDVILPYDIAPVYNRTRLAFKGYDLGMCNEKTLPQNIDGKWYLSPGQLISFIGGDVERTKGKIKISVYGRTVEFAENSDIMTVNGEPRKMSAPCLRLNEKQLYVPVDDFCRPIRMKPLYFIHNNFISIESDTEAIPIPQQE
jgi:acid phosphatase type 7